MDWVSATYNRFETLAMGADRMLGALVERCEDWLAGRGAKRRAKGAGQGSEKTRPDQPISA